MSMPDADLTRRLGACYASVVHDMLRDRGLRDFTLPARLRPIMPDQVLAGPVWPILGRVDPTADAHQTLLEWTGLLSQCPSGHVWVNQPNDDVVAHMGELSAETLADKGVLGCVLDGMARDVDFMLKLGFQTWCTGFTPRDIVGHWLPAAVNVPIRIGMVDIAPGDWVIGDRDGMVRIPGQMIEEVVAEAEEAAQTENAIRTAIKGGMDPQQAYLKYGIF